VSDMGNKSIRRRWLRERTPRNAQAASPRGTPVTIENGLLVEVQPLARPMEVTHAPSCAPILDSWPAGYRGFKLDGSDVILFAEDKPPIRIANALS
jgi:hypothetical protein